MLPTLNTDLLIAGGGLSGGLAALALARRRPQISVTLVEPGAIGGNHIWSFFDSDVSPDDRWLVEPLVCHRWEGHEVRFPQRSRILKAAYNSIESERLADAVEAALPRQAMIKARIATLDPHGAVLEDGTRIDAAGVIDARGIRDMRMLDVGWQKFAGQLLRVEAPHRLIRPIIMDATVDQTDGYRFVYVLPFASDQLFVEDTYYSSSPDMDKVKLGERIAAYALAQGWTIKSIDRSEMAALPIVMGGDPDALWPADDTVPKIGMASGTFQPMTGYSLPDAVRTAALIAGLADLSSAGLTAALRPQARQLWKERAFYRLLGRMLFRASDPPHRYRLLQRFYGLGEPLIGRFYAGRTTFADKARILMGKPPVPLHRALAVLREQ